ncbi:hypothetical protein [Helicobacter mesocricetorum]|uniref:hypothetical protein n=1 Tax=Helicobacter mesocricetorum TaxID=87012 RepID=UPI000CF15F2E|nr:hypothetical protein [Helicobacter mesocricetorum]
MKWKYYLGALLVFVVFLGLYVYSLSGEQYTYHIPFSIYTITLPLAVWFVVPVLLFFVIIVCLRLGGMYRMWRRENKYKNDYKLLLEQIENQLLDKKVSLKQPSMDCYKRLSILLDNLTFDIKKEALVKSGEGRLDELLEVLGDLKQGKEVNLKRFSLPNDSSLKRQNTFNQIRNDEKFALEVLRKSHFENEYKQVALKKLLDSGVTKDIKHFLSGVKMDKSLADTMLGMCYAKKIQLSNEEIIKLCKEIGYTKEDYLHLAQKMKKCYEPGLWVGLFESLADEDEKAEMAYFYVLLDLEMLDEARDRLNTYPKNEFLKIRAYLDLKSFGKKYPLELFLLD